MAKLVVRNLQQSVKTRLQRRARRTLAARNVAHFEDLSVPVINPS